MTEASERALAILRDPSTLQWYVVPLLALTVYVYSVEIERRNWSLVFCGLAFWGMDWLNEIANALVLHLSGHAGLWTAPGGTAFLILSGLNVEICFLFAVGGIAIGKTLPKDPGRRVLGVPNRLVIAVASSVFCVAWEVLLNRAGLLVWAWRYWDVPHLWSIVVFGYLHFHLVAFWVHDMERLRAKVIAVSVIWGVALAAVLVFGVGLGWL